MPTRCLGARLPRRPRVIKGVTYNAHCRAQVYYMYYYFSRMHPSADIIPGECIIFGALPDAGARKNCEYIYLFVTAGLQIKMTALACDTDLGGDNNTRDVFPAVAL
jgi:hypothetical protein